MDLVKLLLGQRSIVGALLLLAAGYLGYDSNDPALVAVAKGAATAGTAAVAVFVYVRALGPKGVLVKLAAGSMPIVYAVLGVLGPPGMDDASRANLAEVVAGVAGLLITWSGLQANTLVVPSSPRLVNRTPGRGSLPAVQEPPQAG